MPSLYTEIEVHAPIQKVWWVLFNKEYWLKWNTFLYDRNHELEFQPGQQIMLSLWRSPGKEDVEFQPTVTIVQPRVCLAWISQIPGLKNEHIFELQKIGFKRTKYVHREEFSGWLTPVFLPFIKDDEKRGIERMAYQLKQYVE